MSCSALLYDSFPRISRNKGNSILEKRYYARKVLDKYRKALLHEPRGHNDMYSVLLVEPDHREADPAVLFMHKQGKKRNCLVMVVTLTVYNLCLEYSISKLKHAFSNS